MIEERILKGISQEQITRFENSLRIREGNPNGCRNWTGPYKGGLPVFSLSIGRNRFTISVYRMAYFLRHGKLPPRQVAHTCGNKQCGDANHIYVPGSIKHERKRFVPKTDKPSKVDTRIKKEQTYDTKIEIIKNGKKVTVETRDPQCLKSMFDFLNGKE